jgi:DNA-binding MarR family transcriptional regulator
METSSRQICDDLLGLLARLKAAMLQAAETYGLTRMQVAAIYSIMHGEETMGQLANAMYCDASNVTGIVDRLVAQDLIRREESKTDRRAKILRLTPKGQSFIDAYMDQLPNYFGCNKISADENKQLHGIVTKLLAE